jgi:hypothetical protein
MVKKERAAMGVLITALVIALLLFVASSVGLICFGRCCDSDTPTALRRQPAHFGAAYQRRSDRLWMEHVFWTRQVMVSFLGGLGDLDAALARLNRNQKDIAEHVGRVYGVWAGHDLHTLLLEHICIAVALTAQAKAEYDENEALISAEEAEAAAAEAAAAEAAAAEDAAAEDAAAEAEAGEPGEVEMPPAEAGEAEMPPAEAGEAEMPPAETGEAEMQPAEAGEAEMPPAEAGEAEMPPAEAGEAEMPPAEAGEGETTEGPGNGPELLRRFLRVSRVHRYDAEGRCPPPEGLTAAEYYALWVRNAGEIADHLSSLRPRTWRRVAIFHGMLQHLRLTAEELNLRLAGRWDDDAAHVDAVTEQILGMSRMLSR